MAAVLGELDRILAVCQCLYTFYEEYKDVNSKFSGLYDDIVIVDSLVSSVYGYYIPDKVKPCLKTVATTLENILKKLKKYETESFFRKLVHVKTRKVYKLEDDLKDQISKIELLIKLKTIRENNSKTDVQRILGVNRQAHDYWVDNFGSDKIVVPFEVFIESVQADYRRLRPVEIEIFKLAMNCAEIVPAQSFLNWILRFGSSVTLAINKMLNSLCNANDDTIFGWFHGGDFRENSLKKLKSEGFGAALVRFSDRDIPIFVVHMNGFGKETCEFYLEKTDRYVGYYLLRSKNFDNKSEEIIYHEIFQHAKQYNHEEPQYMDYLNEKGIASIIVEHDKRISHYYFKNLYIFMWALHLVCESLTKHLNIFYKPVDWNLKEAKTKEELENLYNYKENQNISQYYDYWKTLNGGIYLQRMFKDFPKSNDHIRELNNDDVCLPCTSNIHIPNLQMN